MYKKNDVMIKNITIFFIIACIGKFTMAQENSRLRISVAKKQNTSINDESIVRFLQDATYNFDPPYDAPKFLGQQNLQIWTKNFVGTTTYSINSVPLVEAFTAFKVGIRNNSVDSLILWAHDFATIDANIRIYLHDLLIDSLIDFRKNHLYAFHTTGMNNDTRFRLYFAGFTTYATGSWNYGPPDSLISARISDGVLDISPYDTLKAFDMVIEPCAAVTIERDGVLNLKRHLTLKSDEVSLNGASFIDKGESIIGGDFTYEQNFPDLTSSGWYIAMPVSDMPLTAFADADALYEYDSQNAAWEHVTSPTLEVVRGYVTRYSGQTKLLQVEGTPNKGEQVYNNLYRTHNGVNNYGWNLIGNPYPSTLHWDSVTATATNLTHLNSAIHFRKINDNIASYVNGVGINGGTPYIPPMQAFWVQVTQGQTQGTVTLDTNALVHNCQPFYKKADNNKKPALHISLNKDNKADETAITINSNASMAFDINYDAQKMFSDNDFLPQIFSILNNQKFAINAIPNPQEPIVIPLGFLAHEQGLFEMVFSSMNGFSTDYRVFLEDREEDTWVDLKNNSNYTFKSDKGMYHNRFLLHLLPASLSAESCFEKQNSITVLFHDNMLHVEAQGKDKIGDIIVFNTNGQKVLHKRINDYRFQTNTNFASGIYLISVYSTENELLKTDKLLNQ